MGFVDPFRSVSLLALPSVHLFGRRTKTGLDAARLLCP